MTVRELAIAKLQQLPDSILLEVSDFIDFMMHKHRAKIAEAQPQENLTQAWEKWFDEVERLEIVTNRTENEYQQLLLNKYRRQGLDL